MLHRFCAINENGIKVVCIQHGDHSFKVYNGADFEIFQRFQLVHFFKTKKWKMI